MNNSAVVILSHANSDLKLNILKECIDEVKKKGYRIILSSSYPIPDDVQSSVDYCVLDNENPVIMGDDLNQIDGQIFYWLRYDSFENYYCLDVNHSYAVIKLMKNAASIAKINQIENLHYVNYDYIILDNELIDNNDKILSENDIHYYYIEKETLKNWMVSGFFSIKTDLMIDLFQDINSKKEFCSKKTPILENLMYEAISNKEIKTSKDSYSNIENKNKLDLISISKFFINKNDNKLFLYLSKEDDNYYLITKSDIKSTLNIKSEKFNTDIEIGLLPRVFKIDYEDLESGLDLYVPEFDHKDRFDLNKKLSYCKIFNNDVVEHFIKNDIDNQSSKNDFYSICLRNDTDKVYYHGYHYFYPNYLEKFRYDEFKMLEIGYGDGASMKSWVEYFPKADITVMDINVELEYSNRCRVFKGDQSNYNDLYNISNKIKSAKFIIDDGSHNPLHQIETFYYLFENLLEPGGIYIIEDIELSYWGRNSSLFGIKSGDLNIIHNFLKCNEMVNHEFSGVRNTLDISTVTYAQNCIIITKRTIEESNYFNRNYRFSNCIDSICHY